jgi:hypothetical protein
MMDSIIAPPDGPSRLLHPPARCLDDLDLGRLAPTVLRDDGNDSARETREGCNMEVEHARLLQQGCMEVEHARLLQQGWWLATDGCYRKPEPGKITGLPANDANTGLKNGPTVTASSA